MSKPSRYDIILPLKKYGQLTQLGECLLDVEKVRGSSPLLPTIIRTSPFGLFGFFFWQENPNFALWLVRLGSTIIEGEFCDARTRCSLLRRCRSLRVPYCPPRRNATNFANKTAFAVLFALTSVSPFPKSSLKLFGFLISVLAKSNLDVPFGLVRIFLLEIKKRNRLLPVPFLFQY